MPKAVVTSTFRSDSSRRRLSGIPWRSKKAISDSISAARGFRFLIRSKDIFHVLMIELWLWQSLLMSPRSSSNRSCTSESPVWNISRYCARVMWFSLIKAAAWVIARGMYPRASSRSLECSSSELSRGPDCQLPSKPRASRGDIGLTKIDAWMLASLFPRRSSLVVISIDPPELCGKKSLRCRAPLDVAVESGLGKNVSRSSALSSTMSQHPSISWNHSRTK